MFHAPQFFPHWTDDISHPICGIVMLHIPGSAGRNSYATLRPEPGRKLQVLARPGTLREPEVQPLDDGSSDETERR